MTTEPRNKTPHCQWYCRLDLRGRDVHYHGNAKRKRFVRKHHRRPYVRPVIGEKNDD